MKTVALFGGTFDPPHVGHALAIRQLLDTGRFHEVWVVPSGLRRDKDTMAAPRQRLRMAKLLVRHSFLARDPVCVQSYLVHAPHDYPFTVQEIEFLQERYPDIVITVAVGQDQAQTLSQWHGAETLFRLVEFIVVVRDGRLVHIPQGCRATHIDAEQAMWGNVSSTELRRRLRVGKSISGLTAPSVVQYIEKNGLYRVKEDTR